MKEAFPGIKCQVTACGSFRRGKPTCGDCDVLITVDGKKGDSEAQQLKNIDGVLPKLVEHLEKKKFLVERLGADRIAKTGS